VSHTSDADDIESRARRRVRMKMGFYTHALVYLLVNLALLAINSVGGRDHWHIWPLLWWGIGLAIHGIVTFVDLNSESLRKRMLEQEIARLRDKP